MSDAGRRALVDEFERAFLEFSEYVRELPRELYDESVPGDEGSVRAILAHVVGCGYGHVARVAKSVGGREPERRFPDPESLDDPDAWVAALLDVVRHAREALDGTQDDAFLKRFEVSWGQIYDGEQMMEHATCHPGRHIRQLNRFLDGELTA